MDVDKQFVLTVPSYERVGDHITYNFRLEDTIQNKVYVCSFRFKDLQEHYRRLTEKKVYDRLIQYELPDFPKTHFWKKTNKDPKLIEERRFQLELFFSTIVNDPLIRGHKQIKDFIRQCRKEVTRDQRCRSNDRFYSVSPPTTKRAKSLQRSPKGIPLSAKQGFVYSPLN